MTTTNHTNTRTAVDSLNSQKSLGIWHNPTADYGWGLGPVGSIAAMIAMFAVFSAFVPTENKLRNVFVVAVVGAVIVGPFALRDNWGRNLYARASAEVRWLLHRASGQNFYEAAWFSSTPVTKSRLPGLLSQLSIAEHDDTAAGGKYAVLHHPASKTVSVVVACRPYGDYLADVDVVEAQQHRWSSWLDGVADEPDLAGVQVVSEAAPTTRRSSLEGLVRFRHGHSDFADQMLEELGEACAGGISTSTWVAVSWHTKRREADDFTADVMPARVERLCTELTESGAGTTTPLNANELSRLWTGMYHPQRRETLARYPDQMFDISDAGPTAHNETRFRYKLDSHDTVSLTVGQAPEGDVTTAIHQRLSKGVEGAVAVRWAQLLRPVSPVEARSWSKGIQRAIETRFALTGDRKPKAADLVADEDATNTAAALARGRTLTRAGFTVTLTVEADADIDGPVERTLNACAPLSARLRTMNGVHQTSWVSTLPGAMPIPETMAATQGMNK